MKGIAGYLLAAVVLLVLGAGCLAASRVDRDVAQAQQLLATLDYNGAGNALVRAEKYYEYASHIPGIGKEPFNQIQARKAEFQYWQHDYGTLIPAQPDPIGALPADNVPLQFIVANAIYRNAKAQAKDQRSRIQALDTSINAYLAVLKNSERNEDAAFNYEYLIRLRGAAALKPNAPGDGEAGTEKTTHGQPGGAPRESTPSDFKILIPLEAKEFQDQKEGQNAGKSVARERRG